MPLWIPISLVAILLWITGNIIDKYLIEKFRHTEDDNIDPNTLFLFSAFFALPTALFALAMGATPEVTSLANYAAITAGVLNGIYLLSYLHAIAREELSRITPIFQFIPIFTAFFGWFFLHEILTTEQLIASGFIIAGAVILSYHRTNRKFLFIPIVCILLSSTAFSLQFILFKSSSIETSYWTSVFWSSAGLMFSGILIYLFSKRSRKHVHSLISTKQFGLISFNFLNELLDNAAILIFLFAATLGPVALVQMMHAYDPIIVLIITTIASKLGFSILGEDTSKLTLLQKIIGITFITVGSLIIYPTMMLE